MCDVLLCYCYYPNLIEQIESSDKIWGFSKDVLITIFLFFLGYFLNRVYDNYKKRKDLNRTKEYFICLIKLLSGPIDKLVNTLIANSRILKANDRNFKFTIITSFNIDNINEIKHSDLYDVFVRGNNSEIKERTTHFQLLTENIHLLTFIANSYKDSFTDFNLKSQEKLNELNTAQKAIRHHLENLRSNSKGKILITGDDNFFNEFSAIVLAFNKMPKERMLIDTRNELISPIATLCRKYIADERAVPILNETQLWLDAFKSIQRIIYSHRRYCVKIARKLNTAKLEMNSALEKLA